MQVLAFKLQEAGMMQSHIRARLDDALRDLNRGTGNYGYYIDHTGDESGDLVYSCNGDVRMCSYEISDQGGKSVVAIDSENSRHVVPVTTYQEEADEADHYAMMESALKAEKLYNLLPLYERFISKGEREKASSDDFAGKGKSFPILKPEDVMAAAHAMGRAGPGNLGPSGIKSRIIAIAKRKGWTKYLPKAWQSGASESATSAGRSAYRPGNATMREAFLQGNPEAARSIDALRALLGVSAETETLLSQVLDRVVARETFQSESIKLNESAATIEPIVLREAKADYEIKLIAPGKGSSAFYPAEVLKRDGPKVFGAGTHVYLNHPTSAEEAARPEGDVRNLAGVLTTSAAYHESHAKGPGLYARMKVFADHAQTVEEKAAHVGMSIRASGVAESGKQKGGLPILKELTSAESVDVVTRAGAGGLILTEAARAAGQENEMDEAAVQKLVEGAVAKAIAAVQSPVKALEARALRGDAVVEANRILRPLNLPESSKQRVIDDVLRADLPLKDGTLDVAKFTESLTAQARREAEYVAQITGAGQVRGMGISFVAQQDPEQLKKAREAEKSAQVELEESATSVFASLTGNKEVAKIAAAKGKVA